MTAADHLVMEVLARQFKLSRQTAMMLTLLVVSPQVTATTMKRHFGGDGTDHKVLVARLRQKLKKADEEIVVRNIPTMCYYLDTDVRSRLLANTGRPPHARDVRVYG